MKNRPNRSTRLSCVMILISLGITTATCIAVVYALTLLWREVTR